MLSSNGEVQDLMNLENALVSFISRVNDAFISSHSFHDLVNDSEYQKLVIKHGKAHGIPLGNRHLLPGYWFTVFVAPYEAFQRVLETQKYEDRRRQNDASMSSQSTHEVLEAIEKFKKLAGNNPLQPLIEKFRTEIEFLVTDLENTGTADVFHNKRTLKRVLSAISSGSYEFSEEDDLTCTFFDNDSLCGYRFEVTIKVATLNKFAIDFSKELVELLWPIVENNKIIRGEVAKMFIGQVFSEEH